MKKKWIKTSIAVSLLLSILSLAFSASAEDNGYWTMKTDDSGMPVMIYTYTKPVEWVVDENASYGQCDTQETQPISAVEQADVHMSADSSAVIQATPKTTKKVTSYTATILIPAACLFVFIASAMLVAKRRKLKCVK